MWWSILGMIICLIGLATIETYNEIKKNYDDIKRRKK
jgi:hypothetical protein